MARTPKMTRATKTPRTPNTKDPRRLFVLGVMGVMGAMAATCTPASTNGYYYTTPKTTNIFGRVMAETGDYRLVRQEDVAWLNEAWAERMALSAGLGGATNALPEASLVVAKKSYNSTTFNNDEWWSGGALSTVATNVLGLGFAEMASLASGGAMTNLSLQSGGPSRYGLVKIAWLTNEFAKLKQMRRLVSDLPPTNTWEYIEQEHSKGHHVGNETYFIPPYDYETNNVSTNAASVLSLNAYAEGLSLRSGPYYYDDQEDYEEQRYLRKGVPGGSADVQLMILVESTNAWLRGASSPRVVESTRVWGVAELQYIEREIDTNQDTSIYTNATVLVELGVPRWVRAEQGRLVYEVTLEPATILANCLNVVGWMPGLSEITEASMPPKRSSNGSTYFQKTITGNLAFYLVFDMKPITWVDGW